MDTSSTAGGTAAERTALSSGPAAVIEIDESRLPQPVTGEITTVVRPSTGATGTTEAQASATTPAPGASAGVEAEATMPGTAQAAPGASAQAGTTQSEERGEIEEQRISAADICPSDIDSLRVRARNIQDGAAFVLTARGERDIEALRDRMRQFALAHSQASERRAAEARQLAAGTTDPSPSASLAIHGNDLSPLEQVREVRLIEIPNGVRVELHGDPETDRTTLRQLRASVREDVATLEEGLCPLSFQEMA